MSSEKDIILCGSCHCRSLTYTSTVLPSNLQICHCTTCRALSGTSSLTFADFPRSSLTFTSSASRPSGGILAPDNTHPLQILYTSDVGFRGFCSFCGTPVLMMYHCEPDSIGIAAGTIDEGSLPAGKEVGKPIAHIFLKEKAGWEVLGEDGIERFDEFSEGFADVMKEWKEGGGRERVKPPVVH